MFDGLAGFVTSIASSAQGRLLLAVGIVMVVYGGYQYMTGNHKEGKATWIGTLIGAAVVMLATTIMTAVISLAHA